MRGAAAALAATALATLSLATAGCGDESSRPEIVVFAAASLAPAFEEYADDFDAAEVRFSYAGSDELAAQIRQGLIPDVYAAADTILPRELKHAGITGPATTFATNSLVVAVPVDSPIGSINDLTQDGTSIAIGSEEVPIGIYTRAALDRISGGQGGAILGNVTTRESSVAGIAGKLNLGAVDAGFLYATDVEASSGRLRAIPLPRRLQPSVGYGATIPLEAEHPDLAQRFIDGLTAGPGARTMEAAGFGAPGR